MRLTESMAFLFTARAVLAAGLLFCVFKNTRDLGAIALFAFGLLCVLGGVVDWWKHPDQRHI
jgi:hypothetical protein